MTSHSPRQGLSVRQYNNKTSFVQYARGSLINDRKTKYLGTDNRSNVGRGGISVFRSSILMPMVKKTRENQGFTD